MKENDLEGNGENRGTTLLAVPLLLPIIFDYKINKILLVEK